MDKIIKMLPDKRYMTLILTWILFSAVSGQENILASVTLTETAGLDRESEYIECPLQVNFTDSENREVGVVAVEENSGEKIVCQVIRERELPGQNVAVIEVIFPVSLAPNVTKTFLLKEERSVSIPEPDLRIGGEGLELQIENHFFRADLTKSSQSEAKSHESGQLRELLIKMGYDVLLFRTENRMHWAPNFHKKGLEYYSTIAGWEKPRHYDFAQGPYLIRTIRQDAAPAHPEIRLTATYHFYAGKPYFRFFSEMQVVSNVWLQLLRNDEMTMDSLFTHLAFRRANGEIVDLSFSERYTILEKQPIANEDPWLCFYHADKGYAFGSIRLKYDNRNIYGEPSPTYLPHTKISDGAEGGKYWNRRLIDARLTFVPRGSRYVEENAYLVFRIGETDRFESIKHWAERLRQPVKVRVIPIKLK